MGETASDAAASEQAAPGPAAPGAPVRDESALERDRLRLSRALFPDLAERLDAALAEALESIPGGASLVGDSRGGVSPAAAFDARLDAEAAAMFAGAGLAGLAGSAGGARLQQAFASAEEAVRAFFPGVGLVLPEPEAFEAAGVDLSRLAGLLAADPMLVAVPAPHGLGSDAWRAAFRRAAAAPGGSFSEVDAAGDPQEPLALASEVLREFEALDRMPAGQEPVGRAWTLRLVPAAQQPAILGLNFAHGGPHVTLPEMLMLQLMRAVEGATPLDGGDGRSSFTWLAGSLADGRLAARHVFDAGAIRITAREVGSQGPHLGARPPVA